MKKFFIIAAVLVFTIAFVMAAHAQKQSGYKEEVGTITATVQAVDLQKRIVTVKTEKGQVVDLKAGDRIKNLASVKVGDKVIAKYQKSLAYQVLKPGEAPKPEVTAEVKDTTARGKLMTRTVTVQDIDKNANNVTVKMSDDRMVAFKVKDPTVFEKIKVGDQVEVMYSEAVAISLEKAKK